MADTRDKNAILDRAANTAAPKRHGRLHTAAAACVLTASACLMFTESALAQEPVDRPALVSALEECESGARESALTARALGACDVLMRSPDLDDAMRARVLVNRGLIAHRRGQAGPARDDLEQAVRLAPDLAPAWLNLSAIRIKAGDASGGMEAARRAESLGADRAQSLFNQAIALETGGRYDAAYDAYVAAAAAAPGNATMQAQPARFRRHQAG